MVKIINENGLMKVSAPYNADFVARARQMGGKWAESTWQFDARDEEVVNSALVEVYKTDKEALKKEREALVARLAEIDKMLSH